MLNVSAVKSSRGEGRGVAGSQAPGPSRVIIGCWKRCCPFQLTRTAVDRAQRLLAKIRARETAVRYRGWKRDAKFLAKRVFTSGSDGSWGQ